MITVEVAGKVFATIFVVSCLIAQRRRDTDVGGELEIHTSTRVTSLDVFSKVVPVGCRRYQVRTILRFLRQRVSIQKLQWCLSLNILSYNHRCYKQQCHEGLLKFSKWSFHTHIIMND